MKLQVMLLSAALLLASTFASAMVTFVANDDELNQAHVMFDHEEIQSLAVSQAFYAGSAKRTKDRIRGLVAGLNEHADTIIYVYGLDLSPADAETILGKAVSHKCSPPLFALRQKGVITVACATERVAPATSGDIIIEKLRAFDRLIRK